MAASNAGKGGGEFGGAELEALKADLANIKKDIKSLGEALLGKAQSEMEHVRDSAQERVRSGIDQVEDYVEDRPLMTALIAFGIGLVLGKLFSK